MQFNLWLISKASTWTWTLVVVIVANIVLFTSLADALHDTHHRHDSLVPVCPQLEVLQDSKPISPRQPPDTASAPENIFPHLDRATTMTTINDTSTATNYTSIPPYPQFILFGDSITQGTHSTIFPRLSERYLRRVDIINRGFSGYNTRHALPLLPLIYPTSTPTSPSKPASPPTQIPLLTIWFGANDAVLEGNAQHVPLPEYRDALQRIATHPGVAQHGTQVLFITPPPVDEWRFDEPLTRTAVITKVYADACRGVAADLDLPVVDVWSLFMRKAGWTAETDADGKEQLLAGDRRAEKSEVLADLLSDGLHLTVQGYNAVYDELVRVLDGVKGLAVEDFPMPVPNWEIPMGVPTS
jgi:isoamyl acetate esterase